MIPESLKVNKSRPPLRWFANMCGEISGWSMLKATYMDEDGRYGIAYKIHGYIWKLTWPIYYKFGTFYKIDIDMSSSAWNDYDENGVPYWEKLVDWDYEDVWTGDAFRVINKGDK